MLYLLGPEIRRNAQFGPGSGPVVLFNVFRDVGTLVEDFSTVVGAENCVHEKDVSLDCNGT